MQSCVAEVRKLFSSALEKSFGAKGLESLIVVAAHPIYGDYQCNSAMPLFKKCGKDLGYKSPKNIGEKIVENLENSSMFSSVTVANSGFITVKINNSWMSEQVNYLLKSSSLLQKAKKRLRVAVDFSSPNVAKEMHVGHLRSTIIGDSLCRILEKLGHEVHRLNHVGDWGTQFGMIIHYLETKHESNLNEIDSYGLEDLQAVYRAAKKRFDEDAEFKKQSQLTVVKLQSGDAYARDIWKKVCSVSRKEFEKLYERLDVSLIERGESFYNEMLPVVIEELEESGLLKMSEGAKVLHTAIDEVPLMLIKSDGGYGYDSTDVAALKHRLIDMQMDWVVYITDSGQQSHFHKLFEAGKMAGWHTPGKTRLDFVGFGVIQGEDGKKFKTRSGDTVKLSHLLDEAVLRASKEMEDRASKREAEEDADADLLTNSTEMIGIAAVKYFDLRQNRMTDYKFSLERMLETKGNTIIYIFYSYARICAILRKANIESFESLLKEGVQIVEPSERELVIGLMKYCEVIDSITEDFFIHKLVDYIYHVSELFSEFYKKCRVIGSEQQSSRLLLIELTRKILLDALELLGIKPLLRI